ncbi:MAG: urease accessory protein UreG [Solirubrobacteraceae bacterium]
MLPEPSIRRALARAFRVGIAGPVGTGKSSLLVALCRALSGGLRIGVVTNDIYTTEDAELLRRAGVLAPERIVAVKTGACPHTAIRDDVGANLEAVEGLQDASGGLDIVFIESGGDNLTAVFSPALADRQAFVIDVAGGGDIPRKGGPGIERSDLLVINKRDLAPHVGVDAELMLTEAAARRGGRPVELISLRDPEGVAPIARWVLEMLSSARGHGLEPSGPPDCDGEAATEHHTHPAHGHHHGHPADGHHQAHPADGHHQDLPT